jgi:hypothetical protein
MATPRSIEEINRLTGSNVEPLPAPLERPSRWPAALVALLAAGLLIYGFTNSYTFLGHNLLLPRDAYIPGGIGIVLLFVAEWLWLRQP